MTDNLYFLFLDEIYAPNLNDMLKFSKEEIFSRPNHLHFGISEVIVGASSLKDIMLRSERIKKKFYPRIPNLIFHYVDILNRKDEYSDLKLNSKKDAGFKSSLAAFIGDSDFKFDYVFIDKHELIMIENFYLFLTSRKISARGIIVAEARGEREDTELREAFKKIYYYGIGKVPPTELRRQVLELFIVPKKQNYIGTQMADLVLYPTYDGAISQHHTRTDHFISYQKCLKKKCLDKTKKLIP